MLGRDNSGGSQFDRSIAALARVQQVWLRREKMFATANVLSRASPLPRRSMPYE